MTATVLLCVLFNAYSLESYAFDVDLTTSLSENRVPGLHQGSYAQAGYSMKEESRNNSIQVNHEFSMAEEFSSFSCEELQALGCDMTVWDVVKTAVHAGERTVGFFVFIAFFTIDLLSAWNPSTAAYDVNQYWTADFPWFSMNKCAALLQSEVLCVFNALFTVALAVYLGRKLSKEYSEVALFLVLLPLLVGLVVGVLLVVFVMVLFPMLQKLKVWHMERAIVYCMPLPNGQQLAFGEYVLPAYVMYLLYVWTYSLCYDTLSYPPGRLTKMFALFNVYTQAAVMLSTWDLMPTWWLILWLVTVISSVWQLKLLFDLDEDHYKRLLIAILLAVQIPSVFLTMLAIIRAYSVQSAYLDQYQVYSFLGMLGGTLAQGRKLAQSSLRKQSQIEPLLGQESGQCRA